jgi:UDP-N-acetylglucosamine 2-epimerase (non-hydrolysing)
MLLISFGTRPEYIKIKPLLRRFDGVMPYALLFTGQHTSLLENVIDTTYIRRLQITDGDNRLDSIVASIMNNDHVFSGITSVMVQGDTTSAFAVGLAAFHRKIDVIHLEAGLRTWDMANPYPEEFNRQALSRLATTHLCPTDVSAANLKKENVLNGVHIVGNTVLDNIRDVESVYGNTVLVTLHRRENHAMMDKWFSELESIAKDHPEYEFIIPLHPNPNVQQYRHLLQTVKVVEPLGHPEFIRMIANCRFIITDSGGIQEEASFLRKKCIVCRKTTERVEGMGVFAYMCPSPSQLREHFDFVNRDDNHIPDIEEECPYGDGFAAEKIYGVLKNEV